MLNVGANDWVNWWLRSPGGVDTAPASVVNTSGGVGSIPANSVITGFRPAIWVYNPPEDAGNGGTTNGSGG